MEFCPCLSTQMRATPVDCDLVACTALTSTPAAARLAFRWSAKTSYPTRPIRRTATAPAPNLPAAQAWLAPLPPGIIRKSLPSTVSPGTGRRSTDTTKSMFRLPTTTRAVIILASSGKVDAQFLQLFGIVSAVQQIPLLAALGNLALLRPDLLLGKAVHLVLGGQNPGDVADDFEPHFVGVLLNAQLPRLAQRHDDLVRHVVDLVARQLHLVVRVASGSADDLAFRDHGVLDLAEHFLVTDAFAAHVIAILLQNLAHFVVEAVLDRQFLGDNIGDDLGDGPRIACFNRSRRQFLHQFTGEISDEFPGKQHPVCFLTGETCSLPNPARWGQLSAVGFQLGTARGRRRYYLN